MNELSKLRKRDDKDGFPCKQEGKIPKV